jgi:hypothetical protein
MDLSKSGSMQKKKSSKVEGPTMDENDVLLKGFKGK